MKFHENLYQKNKEPTVNNYSMGFVTAVKACSGLRCFNEVNYICLYRFSLAISACLWHPVISWTK